MAFVGELGDLKLLAKIGLNAEESKAELALTTMSVRGF